ncbi:MAG: hypothetical protein BRC29_02120 [Nanohaloarchaea archaeon SW_7_43_1]|nr:MAG: hypothetical protein BRC29_02120 [Nanohaloarchaea archaeon SW_7_43_1]
MASNQKNRHEPTEYGIEFEDSDTAKEFFDYAAENTELETVELKDIESAIDSRYHGIVKVNEFYREETKVSAYSEVADHRLELKIFNKRKTDREDLIELADEFLEK